MAEGFKKILGIGDAVSMVIGIIIGSGIFLTTGIIAESVTSPFWILAVWALGGVITASLAFTFAQLASLYPQSGGAYVYLREACGGGIAFVYGIALFTVIQGGSIAAISLGFARYFGELLPCFSLDRIWVELKLGGWQWQLAAGQVSAVCLIWIFTYFNYVGGRTGVRLQNFLTALKILALLAFFFGAVCLCRKWSPGEIVTAAPSPAHLGVALIAVLWTFAGAHNINFAAEEVDCPQSNIPRALMAGIAIVTAIYLAVNVVYVFAVPLADIRGVEAVAAKVANPLFGAGGRILVCAAIVVSTAGAVNGLVFASPRAYFTMAQDGVFGGFSPRLHPRYHTPANFLLLQGVWTSLLALTGTYKTLFTFVMFSGFLFFGLIGVSLLILHRRHPHRKMVWEWGYPLIPLFYILTFIALAVNTLLQCPRQSLAGILLLFLALPLYPHLKKRNLHRE